MDNYCNSLVQPTQASESHREFEIRGVDPRDLTGRRNESSRDNTWRRRVSRRHRPMALSVRRGPLG
jgi:hypothetical protein